MIYSDERKQRLSGWLKKNHAGLYNSSLRLQKFLFFYEAFSKVNNEVSDFNRLEGYRHGPVFSKVYGDYTYDRSEFDSACELAYSVHPDQINVDFASICANLVDSLTEEELSSLTHEFNIWSSKRERIESGEKEVPLNVSDFNQNDYNLIDELSTMYRADFYDHYIIIPVMTKRYVFKKDDYDHLTKEHMSILYQLSRSELIHNPVYIEIDLDGGLIFD